MCRRTLATLAVALVLPIGAAGAKVKETLTKLSLPSAGVPAWRGIASGTEALAWAFDLPKP